MIRAFILAVATMGVTGCMSQADMDAAPYIGSFVIPMPYQQAFANTNRGIRACNTGGGGHGQVDGQLYPDLGYGEITTSLTHEFGAFVSTYVKVTKVTAQSARVDIKSAAKVKTNLPDWVRYWSNGGSRCPALGEAPPSQ